LGKERAYLNDIYYCPHHPDSGYPGENSALKIDCECRKPKTGMIRRAAEQYNIDLTSSWMIGDTTTDIQTGINAGLKTILVRTGDAGKDSKWRVCPDYTFDDFKQAIDFILVSADAYDACIRGIVDEINAHSDAQPVVVTIGGLARSGKSTFAAYLKSNLLGANIPCRMLSLDNWLLNLSDRNGRQTVRERYRYRDIEQDVRKIIDGKDVVINHYDPLTRTVDSTHGFSFENSKCLIVEGVPALDIAGLRNMSRIKIYVDCDESIRHERFLRFYRWKGMSDEQINEILRLRTQDETPYVVDSKRYADFLITLQGLS
jgi:uridine kinase